MVALTVKFKRPKKRLSCATACCAKFQKLSATSCVPFIFAILVMATSTPMAKGADYADLQSARPELFDPTTGYRMSRQRGPTPDNIPPPARVVSAYGARVLINAGAIALDVFSATQSRFDELDGSWLVSKERLSLPDAVWLPETGRARLEPVMQRYLEQNLAELTANDPTHPIIVFCVADCWMSWNAAQRIAGMGYTNVFWFRLGTDGWLDIGGTLFPVKPRPVSVD